MMVDDIMGGVSVFLFGDLFQLKPIKEGYVFDEPKSAEHSIAFKLRNLWQQFMIVNLEENHRQGEDKEYGDLLNRIRRGIFTDEDVEVMKTRVRKQNDPELKKYDSALHIYGTNAKVNARNQDKLNNMEGELYTIKATHASHIIRNFKPTVDKAGCVTNTPFQVNQIPISYIIF